MPETFAVIGSNCFTGSHIVDALVARPGARVAGISRSPEKSALYLPYKQRRRDGFSFHQIDSVREHAALVRLLDDLRPEVVVNVAALSEVGLSNDSPVEYFDINTTAVVKLCNQLRTRPYLKRYVHISSAEIFGSCPHPVTEEQLFNPSTPYAVSKAAADMHLMTLVRNFRFPATLIRSTNVYGRHQQLFKIIPRTVIRLKQGNVIELHGGGHAIKSFIHIRDVVSGLTAAIDRGGYGAYHFTVQSDRTIGEIVTDICRRLGFDPGAWTRIVGERLGQDSRYTLDCTRAERELGWAPRVPFDEGVAEVIAWIQDNWVEIQAEPQVYQHVV